MITASLAVFILQIYPDLKALAKALFAKHGGDVAAASQELRRITDHGAQLDNFEQSIQGRLARLKQREADVAAAEAAKKVQP